MTVRPFAFGGFRSFPPALHRFPSVGKINLIAGANNSGKSNVLAFLREHYVAALAGIGTGTQRKWSPRALDRHHGKGDGSFWFSVGLQIGGDDHAALRSRQGLGPADLSLVDQILAELPNSNGVAWFDYTAATFGAPLQLHLPTTLLHALADYDWRRLWTHLTGQQGGSLTKHWHPETVAALCPRPPEPTFAVVDAVRRIGVMGNPPSGHSGEGIIDRLAQLQNPSQDKQGDKQRFEDINKFLQVVAGDGEARLEVPYQRDSILVHQHGRTLPLESLGTGIHEVIILAVAATVLQNTVLCIEEPELHLHPVLQRKLLKYLKDHTTNQYFITTHSAAMLDATSASIYHVSHDGDGSSLTLAAAFGERHELCLSLGYHASDLLQANCVLWVEGPSDRLYVTYWLAAIAPELVEGVHYSVMFYGGRLLAHVTADDPEVLSTDVAEFIELRRLNRHVAVLMDSDRSSTAATLNQTKLRVQAELERTGGFAWVTAGREIENYIPRDVLKAAIAQLRSDVVDVPASNRFQPALRYRNNKGRVVPLGVDKMRVARAVVAERPTLDILDLPERMAALATYIRSANPTD